MPAPTLFVTFWGDGYAVCTIHKTLAAAQRAVAKCERDPRAAKHRIFQLTEYPKKPLFKVRTVNRNLLSPARG